MEVCIPAVGHLGVGVIKVWCRDIDTPVLLWDTGREVRWIRAVMNMKGGL